MERGPKAALRRVMESEEIREQLISSDVLQASNPHMEQLLTDFEKRLSQALVIA